MSALDKFTRITGYDLSIFFGGFTEFVSNYYDNYVGYYSGANELDRGGVELLNLLKQEADRIEELFELSKDTLSGDIEAIDLYSDFTDVKVKIETSLASPKWTRSSYVNDYDRNVNVVQILKDGQSLEDLSYELGYTAPEEDWVKLAVDNALSETLYDGSGGNLLHVSFSNNSRINTTSVVDVMIGENVLGKDLSVKIAIEDNDLKALTPRETLDQAAGILINIMRGSVPEFPNDGISGEVIGSNLNLFRYPIVFRQLSDIFRKDDTFKELEMIGVERNVDNVEMSVKIISKLNDVLNKNVYMNG